MTHTRPRWLERSIWYHLFPLGFLGAERDNPAPGAADGAIEHRIPRLEAWLGYLVDLGVDTLLLGPVFESETHGYDTVDYYRVDRRLGDEADLIALVEACHRLGLRVVLDGVFNHVARSFPQFRDVLDQRDSSPWANWFQINFDEPGRDGFTYADFEGHGHLVQLRHDEPAVVELLVDVACHWLDRGIDGWRLDAAYAVPTTFWDTFSTRVRARHPHAVLVGEVIHGDYGHFVTAAGVDSVTQYELWKAIWSSLNDANFFELAHALGRHGELTETFPPYNFVGNHDVTRIASRLNDFRHVSQAVAMLLTLPGVPAIYAGDEQGFTGIKLDEIGGDDAVRPAFPAHPSDLPAHGWGSHALHHELIALRRRHPAAARGRIELVQVSNERLAYRVAGEDDELLVALNIADTDMQLPLPSGSSVSRVEAGSAVMGHRTVTVAPHSWAVMGDGR